jgi:hypothetical protein
MMPKWMLVVWLLFSAIPGSAQSVSALTDRTIRLAQQEPIASAIDTRFRLAEALMPSDSRASRRFLSQAVELLKSHPEAPRTYGMAASLLFLNAAEGDTLLLGGPDRVDGYKLILRYEHSLFETKQMAATFRRALSDSAATPRIAVFQLVRPVLTERGALGEDDPKDGASLFLQLAEASRGSGFEPQLPVLLSELLTSFANVLPARAVGVREALISLLPFVQRPNFAAGAPFAGAAKFSAGERIVETRTARDAILFRVGTLLHSLDQKAFQETGDLFAAWGEVIASVTSLEAAVRVVRPAAGPRPSPADAIAAANRLSPGAVRANALAAIAHRGDASSDQRRMLVEHSLDDIASISPPGNALLAAGNVLDAARRSHLDAALSQRVLFEYLGVLRRAGQSPDDYFTLALAEQDLGVVLDSGEDAILAAKRAIVQLQKAPDTQPVANFQKGHSLGPDGRGPYRTGDEHTVVAAHTYALSVCTEAANCSTVPETANPRQANRALQLDLNAPVPNTGAIPRGVVRSTEVNFSSFPGVDRTQTRVWDGMARLGGQRMRDIPIGKTVPSDRTEIRFFIGSAQHIMQFGPSATGYFQTTAQVPFHGEGTTRAVITRETPTTWLIRSGPGSMGRLWDNRDPSHPVDLGLYYFSFDVRVAQLPVH